jgi:hypothetical protein
MIHHGFTTPYDGVRERVIPGMFNAAIVEQNVYGSAEPPQGQFLKRRAVFLISPSSTINHNILIFLYFKNILNKKRIKINIDKVKYLRT